MRSVAAGPGRSPWNTCVRPSPSISVKRPVLMVFSRIRANSILFDPRQIGASLNRLLPAGQVAAAAGLPGIFATRGRLAPPLSVVGGRGGGGPHLSSLL